MGKNNVRRDLIREEMERTGTTYNVARRALEARNWEPAEGATPEAVQIPDSPVALNAVLDATSEGIRQEKVSALLRAADYQPNEEATGPTGRSTTSQKTIVLTAANGSPGVTTTAITLAACIAKASEEAMRQGERGRPLSVVILDLDTVNSGVGSLLDRFVPTALNMVWQPTLDDKAVMSNLVFHEKLGVHICLAPILDVDADAEAAQAVNAAFYHQVLSVLQRQFDVVIVDAGHDPELRTMALNEASGVLVVTTLALQSIQGLHRFMDRITRTIPRKKMGIVVNQSVTDVGMSKDKVVVAADQAPIVGAIPLATRDVLTAINYNRLHLLLKHPQIGPALFRLAKACMQDEPLSPPLASESDAAL